MFNCQRCTKSNGKRAAKESVVKDCTKVRQPKRRRRAEYLVGEQASVCYEKQAGACVVSSSICAIEGGKPDEQKGCQNICCKGI